MRRVHNQETIERFEDVRMISFSALRPYMDKSTTIQRFWSLPSDEIVDENKVSDAKKMMDEVTAKYKEIYNR